MFIKSLIRIIHKIMRYITLNLTPQVKNCKRLINYSEWLNPIWWKDLIKGSEGVGYNEKTLREAQVPNLTLQSHIAISLHWELTAESLDHTTQIELTHGLLYLSSVLYKLIDNNC